MYDELKPENQTKQPKKHLNDGLKKKYSKPIVSKEDKTHKTKNKLKNNATQKQKDYLQCLGMLYNETEGFSKDKASKEIQRLLKEKEDSKNFKIRKQKTYKNNLDNNDLKDKNNDKI